MRLFALVPAMLVAACAKPVPYDLRHDLGQGDPVVTADVTIVAAATRDRELLETLGRREGRVLELTCRRGEEERDPTPCIEALFLLNASRIEDRATAALLTGIAVSRVAQDKAVTVQSAALRKAIAAGRDERAAVAAAALVLGEAVKNLPQIQGADPGIIDSLMTYNPVPSPAGLGRYASVEQSERRALLERSGSPPSCREAVARAPRASGLERARNALMLCDPTFYRVRTRDEAAVLADATEGFVVTQILGAFADARRLVAEAPGRLAATLRRDLLPRFDRTMREVELVIPPPPIWLDAQGARPVRLPSTERPGARPSSHSFHLVVTANDFVIGKALRIRWRSDGAGPRITGLRSEWRTVDPRSLAETIRPTRPSLRDPVLVVDRDLPADRAARALQPLESHFMALAAFKEDEVVSIPLRVGRPDCNLAEYETHPTRLSIGDRVVQLKYLDTVLHAESMSQLETMARELYRSDGNSFVQPVELRCAPGVTMARALQTMDALVAGVHHASPLLTPSTFACPPRSEARWRREPEDPLQGEPDAP